MSNTGDYCSASLLTAVGRDLNDLGQQRVGIVASGRSPSVDPIRGPALPGTQVPGSGAYGIPASQPGKTHPRDILVYTLIRF